ncbi:MAG: glycosyltransferase, partial [Terriglobia bacterium]
YPDFKSSICSSPTGVGDPAFSQPANLTAAASASTSSSAQQPIAESGRCRVDLSAVQRHLRIAYIGPEWGTSLHRARALERLRHTVTLIDPWSWLGRSKWVARWLHHAGGFGVGLRIDRRLFEAVAAAKPELIFVNQGEFLGPALVKRLRTLDVPIVNYTNDNPFGGYGFGRYGGLRFHHYRKAIPLYDLLAVTFAENVAQAHKAGARHVMRVWLTADEVVHQPRELSPEVRERYAADVAFIGTWMPERGPFMAELIGRGVPLSLWGERWHKAPEWPVIAPHWRGPGIYDDDGYAAAIQSARICLGLLSKGNRNLHTGRSLQIPALGGLLCAQRTSEHQALYEEGREAIFWEDAAECAAQCQRLLADEPLRREIARRGQERARRNNHYNEPMLTRIIEVAFTVARGRQQ